MPGEKCGARTASGKIGTPTTQIAGMVFDVWVHAVDAYWNVLLRILI